MQRLTMLGLNHKTAAVELREKLAFSPPQRKAALLSLRNRFGECEAVLLSTCNRVELYIARQTHGHPHRSDLEQFLADERGLKPEDFQSHLYEKSEREAVTHLFSVASSLDSMVLGESQILAQVREAYDEATEAGTTGAMLHPLFQRAVAVGKQVRSQTNLSEGRVSLAGVAVEYARRIFDVFTDKTVLSIGAGKMAGLVLKHLASLNPKKIIICNRDLEKAQKLAPEFNAAAVGIDAMAESLASADIVLTSTGSTEPIIHHAMFDAVMRKRRYRPVYVIDIAVPRDVAADVGKIENVYLYNLDDLQRAVTTTHAQRGAAAEAAEKIIERHVLEFIAWHRARMMGPLIDHLYQQSHAIAQQELAKTLGKLPSISPADKEQLEELTRRIVNKLLHDPIQVMREGDGSHAPMSQYLHAVEKLFKLESENRVPPNSDADKPDGHVA